MIGVEDPRTPPDDLPDQRECDWCGLMFTPAHDYQRTCSRECGLSEAGLL